MESWWHQWGAHHRLLVVTVRNCSGQLVAVAPFYIRRSRLGGLGPRALCFLANDYVGSDHLDLLIDPEYVHSAVETIVRLADQYRAEWDYIELFNSQEASPGFARLCQGFKALGMTERIMNVAGCPYAALPTSFDAYLASVGANLRYNFRRRRRALEREGGVEFVAFKSRPDIQEHYGELLRLHGLRFGQKQMESAFLLPRVQEFHAEALPRLAANGMARLYLLQSKGRAIAALYGFSVGKTFAFYQAGMDPAWSRLSAGLVMMGCAIEEAIRTGHDEFDFLEGDQTYKFQWAAATRRNVSLCFFDRRIRSRWAWSRFSAFHRMIQVKRLVRRYGSLILGLLRVR
jgi:CelD/BcsL family acetyltransferase involved in cellulose biosynthesis